MSNKIILFVITLPAYLPSPPRFKRLTTFRPLSLYIYNTYCTVQFRTTCPPNLTSLPTVYFNLNPKQYSASFARHAPQFFTVWVREVQYYCTNICMASSLADTTNFCIRMRLHLLSAFIESKKHSTKTLHNP